MAIIIRLAESKTAWGRGDFENLGIEIENGLYHFMIPEIEELGKKFGKFIDQYGDVFFEPHTIKPLLTILIKAQIRAQKMKNVESVVTGIDMKNKKEYRIDIQKKFVLQILGKLILAAEKAEKEKKYLIFVGD